MSTPLTLKFSFAHSVKFLLELGNLNFEQTGPLNGLARAPIGPMLERHFQTVKTVSLSVKEVGLVHCLSLVLHSFQDTYLLCVALSGLFSFVQVTRENGHEREPREPAIQSSEFVTEDAPRLYVPVQGDECKCDPHDRDESSAGVKGERGEGLCFHVGESARGPDRGTTLSRPLFYESTRKLS